MTEFWFLMPALGLTVLVALHIGILRLAPGTSLPRAFWLAGAGGVAAELVLDALVAVGQEAPVSAWLATGMPNAVICVFLAYSYYHFFNLGETGRRIRLLRELATAPEGLTEAELMARYTADEVVERRLRRMEESGAIEIRDGRVYALSAGLGAATRLIVVLKVLIFGTTSEHQG